MKWLKALGEATALMSMLVLLLFFVGLTVNGITTGVYRIVIDSNLFFEHYVEFFLLVAGTICYIYFRRIRFTFHPKKQGR